MKKESQSRPLWVRFVRRAVKGIYPDIKIEGSLPEEPCIIVSNHCQIHGPIVYQVCYPRSQRTWCAWEMTDLKAVPDYAYGDFWQGKPQYSRWFYRLMSYLIAPLCALVFTHADAIPVYRDNRVVKTFRMTLDSLESGTDVVIFPECHRPYNHILWDFEDRFIDVARQYYKRTGKRLRFVPAYLCPDLNTLYIGNSIRYDPDTSPVRERARIKEVLMDRITAMAEAAPDHRVTPYPNLPKKQYPRNHPKEAPQSNETTRS